MRIVISWTLRGRPDLRPPGSPRPPANRRCRVTRTRHRVLLRTISSLIQVIDNQVWFYFFWNGGVVEAPVDLPSSFNVLPGCCWHTGLWVSLVYGRSPGKGQILRSWTGYRHLVESDMSWSVYHNYFPCLDKGRWNWSSATVASVKNTKQHCPHDASRDIFSLLYPPRSVFDGHPVVDRELSFIHIL